MTKEQTSTIISAVIALIITVLGRWHIGGNHGKRITDRAAQRGKL